MARNTSTAHRSNGRSASQRTPQRLSHRVVGAAALTVAGLVLLAGHGQGAVAALGAVALYTLVKGRRGPVAGSGTTARQVLRSLCWVVVALAVAAAAAGSSAPGGATLGAALAAGLATALRLTSQGRRG